MYFLKKGREYFFPEIDKKLKNEGFKLLSEDERNIFSKMMKYDQFHSLEVYRKIKNTSLKNKNIYLRMALLHDCGKGKVFFVTRIFHKMGFNTRLKTHSEKGYEILKNIDSELAVLVKNHHKRNYSEEMTVFQKCDDES